MKKLLILSLFSLLSFGALAQNKPLQSVKKDVSSKDTIIKDKTFKLYTGAKGGLTLDSAKTPEYKEAKKQYEIWFAELRNANGKLTKLRKHVGYKVVNGKRVSIYKEI